MPGRAAFGRATLQRSHRGLRRLGGSLALPSWRLVLPSRFVLATFLLFFVFANSAFSQDTVTNIMSPIVSYQYPENLSSEVLTNGGISSPIVSYEYPENLANEALTNGDISSPIVSYEYPENLANEALTNGDISSPIVSYQYPDNLVSEILTNGGIMSPIISYQYYEWPGYGILNLQSSPVVSYFYDFGSGSPIAISVQGRVSDSMGLPVFGATVTASFFSSILATAQSALDGSFALSAITPGSYLLQATNSGYIADERLVVLSAVTAQQNFKLVPVPPPLQIQTAGSTPPLVQPPDNIQGAKLRVFDGAGFQTGLPLDKTKMTIVLTHGWVQFLSSGFPPWPTNMALAMNVTNVTNIANIVVWDWHQAATTCWPPPWWKTRDQGTTLGTCLYQKLGAGYSQPIHFIGHSLGTLVNAEAANFLTGNRVANEPTAPSPWSARNIQLTMFDEAELAIEANEILTFGAIFGFASGPSTSSVAWEPDYVSPIPLNWANYAWIDNYISAFGLFHREAVNVYLSEATNYFSLWDRVDLLSLIPTADHMHGYSTFWYQASVTNATNSPMGFVNSFERTKLAAESVFPPESFAGFPGNDLDYEQSGESSDFLDDPAIFLQLQSVAGSEAENWNAPFLPQALPYGLDSYLGQAQVESTLLIAGAQAYGTVNSELIQETIIGFDDALNYLAGQNLQTGQSSVDLMNQAQVNLTLTAGPPPPVNLDQPVKLPLAPSNTPACIWLTVAIPDNAADLSFAFTVSGDGAQDSLVFGANNRPLFSMGLSYLSSRQSYNSGLIDVSAYAGTTNQLFFGILGGTSTNASVKISNIEFLSSAQPSLSISQSNSQTFLSWPSSANGFALASATDLITGDWEAVTNVPALFGGFFTVTNSWPDQARFFRLQSH
jgi:hypothetical protein